MCAKIIRISSHHMSRNLCSVRRVRIVHVVRHGRSILSCRVHLCISSRCHIIGGMHSIHSTRI